ncbi:protein methyltransferase [Pseudovirgaria hyperparasitica]|uniref:Protein methyltransferase n=1 Tax=Pseudovirgaria hyperparasitica TaxID=470096 RepID=A0A6A6WBV1_9PEZI|nr:protein methyltransferase [Pseudovirgaria hyperparasitica]KAF2759639.1 protein methyltransferase [Pseudovirgaria hyperparasitica]
MSAVKKDTLPLTRSAHLVLVSDTPKGRGVFAQQNIDAHTVIETCPVLVLDPVENTEHIEHTTLYHYTYNWPMKTANGSVITTQAVVFGLGSMFNHSHDQNVGWERNVEKQVVTYKTLRSVSAGEELCISYGSHLTFKDVSAPPEEIEEPHEMLSKIQLD